jgi:hypothetical protein
MALERQKALILEQLRNGRRAAIDEAEAWTAITAAARSIQRPSARKADQKRWADEYVVSLGLIYARYTGTLPGFTNCQAETRFERFVRAVMVEEAPIHVSRNLIKSAIRRMDAKHHPQFMHYLNDGRAAE